jgi:magnesium-transporting ATPase (P-type)
MLWINLVMDILAAIALGTGCDSIKKGRISRKEKVFEAGMWRQIIVQSFYQIIVNLVIVYFGGMMIGKEYNLVTTDPRNPGKVLTDTFLFHTFFMMTMFNQINSRIVDPNDMNMLKTVQSNLIFWFIWLGEMALQHLMLFWASNSETGMAILGMADIGIGLQVISVVIGAFSFVVHVVHVKLIPIDKFAEIDEKLGIESEAGNAVSQIDSIFTVVKGRLNQDEDDDDDYNRYIEPGQGAPSGLETQP